MTADAGIAPLARPPRSLLAGIAILTPAGVPAARQAERISIHVDTADALGPMTPMWAWFGYDEPNYTYTPNGRKLLSELAAASPVPVFVRTHNLLTTGRRRRRAQVGIDERLYRRRTGGRSTTGRSSIASSTRISNAR